MPTALRIRKLRRVFDAYDLDRDGIIEESDILALVHIWCETYELEPDSPGWTDIDSKTRAMFRDIPGLDGAEKVRAEEWIAMADHPDFARFVESVAIPHSMAVFTAADKDGDGRISAREMLAAQIKAGMSLQEADQAFALLDADGDGYLTYDEYIQALREFYLSDDPAAHGNRIAGEL
ncbi:EF-hand domain-containing protein [Nocardia panacis]|uniref:EF-hand domain-containing protein n=1 Tax=Nocardia panacis TaxID=2340916 RepID=A0A3A4KRJ6_9NOCA|nr:EF-hand domain-containing protein [Nocardia panacis]RJO72512.1 EF-hand domain-containing protein [Nocardia panacis]